MRDPSASEFANPNVNISGWSGPGRYRWLAQAISLRSSMGSGDILALSLGRDKRFR